MTFLRYGRIALALGIGLAALGGAPAAAQGVGSKVPAIELEGFSQTPAKSYDDYLGRAVLLEFFAYW
jgi:hypothetical protein